MITGSAPLPQDELLGEGEPITYSLLASRDTGAAPPPSIRAPAGWSTLALLPGIEFVLEPAEHPPGPMASCGWLRLTTAVDERVQRVIDVGLRGGPQIGVLDLRYAHALEMFQLELTGADAVAALRDGAIQDADVLSAEGSYTVAFPLAALAVARNSGALAALALEQLRIRQARLWHEGALWLRCMDNGQRSFRNWARAVAWYLLGLVRTLELLRDRVTGAADLEAEARRVATWVQGFQRDDGLWAAYVDDPGLAADTSGSAGVAAALALGARIGILPQTAADAARRTLDGLQRHLTPDGFLGGATQANRGGEILQRSDYRVLSQMAMGLQAQLIAELSALEAIA